MYNLKFYSDLNQLVHKIHSQWKYILPIVLISILWYSCDEETPLTGQQNSDETSLNDGNKLLDMTEADLMKYYGVKDVSQLVPGYTYSFIDTLDTEELKRIRRKLSVRSSEDCGINVELLISGPADTARVTVYEANTSTVVHGPVLMVDSDDFNMTINGAEYYDFEIEPIDNPTGSSMGNLVVDPDWGGKTIFSFSAPGIDFNEDYHFECPEATDGTCDAYASVKKHAGSVAKYSLGVDPDQGTYFPVNGIPDIPFDETPFAIDETWAYDFSIRANMAGSSESFSVQIIRPDGIAHNKSFYGIDMSSPHFETLFEDFNYFDCPYD